MNASFQTLNARHLLLAAEIELALNNRISRPGFPTKVNAVGRGVFFAFKGEHYRARIDDGGTGIMGQLTAKDPVGVLKMLHYSNELMEWGMLRGAGGELLPEGPEKEGLEKLRARDAERVHNDEQFAQLLQENPKLRRQLPRALLLRELYVELGDEFVNLPRMHRCRSVVIMWRLPGGAVFQFREWRVRPAGRPASPRVPGRRVGRDLVVSSASAGRGCCPAR